MEKKIIYIESDYVSSDDFSLAEFESLSNEEKLHVAKNNNNMIVYSLEGFQFAFNNEMISDLGYIFIV